MRMDRVINRGRIAPSSPRPILDSGRTSFSSASAVSTIDCESPEPPIHEQVAQKLETQTAMSTTKKGLIIAGCVAAALLLILGISLGISLPLTLNRTTTTTLTTTLLSDSTKISFSKVYNTTTTTVI